MSLFQSIVPSADNYVIKNIVGRGYQKLDRALGRRDGKETKLKTPRFWKAFSKHLSQRRRGLLSLVSINTAHFRYEI